MLDKKIVHLHHLIIHTMKKRIIATLVLALGITVSAKAQFGVFQPSEKFDYVDEGSGKTITVLTDTTRNDRFLYQTDPMFTADGKYIVFRSSSREVITKPKHSKSTDTKQPTPTRYFFIELATGKIIQATDDNQIGGIYLGNRSNVLFYNKRDEKHQWTLYRMDLGRFFADAHAGHVKPSKAYEVAIGTFPESMGRPNNFCVSCDDRWAYITVERDGTDEEKEAMMAKAFKPRDNQPIKIKPVLSGIRKMDLTTGEVSQVADVDFRTGHIQCSRFRPEEIVFCNETGGDADQRMWYCTADGDSVKPLYHETPLDWVTHETFASEDYVYFNVLGFQDRLRKQASGIFRINLRTDDIEIIGQVELSGDATTQLTGRGFWHCNASRDDRWAAGDTFAGNVWLIDVASGQRTLMATDARMKPDHAQPFFSPDGKYMFYQSGHFTDGKRLNLMMTEVKAN